jgi:hypothetical protein
LDLATASSVKVAVVWFSSTYLSSDDEITSTDNQYTSLENALQNQLDNIESTYPGYE